MKDEKVVKENGDTMIIHRSTNVGICISWAVAVGAIFTSYLILKKNIKE